MIVIIDLSSKLLNARIKSGLSRSYVAGLLGCTPTAVGLWETGKREPCADVLIKLIHIYNLSIADFFGEPSADGLPASDVELLRRFHIAPIEIQNIIIDILKKYRKD